MKIFCLTTVVIWVAIVTTANADYRYKRRGPMGPPPPRSHMPHGNLPHGNIPHGSLPHGNLPHGSLPHGNLQHANLPHANLPHGNIPHANMPHPHMPHHMPPHHKKYHGPPPPQLQQHGPRGPIRQRPIPHHHINPSLLGPKGPVPNNLQKRPLPLPNHLPIQVSSNIKNVWKSPQPNYNSIKVHQEKPFVSSPTVPKKEFDYHIQTNSIPNHLNTIKQVDEKGPIHTIPAPKLSAADKPKIVEEVKSIHKEALRKPQAQPHQHEHTIVQVQKAHQYQVTELNDQKPYYIKQEPLILPSEYKTQDLTQSIKLTPGSYANSNLYAAGQDQLLPTELFKVINTYPQQQQLLDTYPLPILQQPQLQQHLTQQGSQQTLLVTPQIYEKQVAYSSQIQHDVTPNDKVQVQADFQAYNFDPSGLEDTESRGDLKYTQTKRADYGEESVDLDALAQTQYVQNYYDTRDESLEVTPDAKPSQETYADESVDSGNPFFASLGNKKAADALSSLQEAGKANSINTPKKASHKLPMTIYVPDETEFDESKEKSSDSNAYDDATNQDDNSKFGNSQPKNS